MKTIARALTLCLFAVFFGISCEKTPDGPPIEPPVYDGPPANMTIAELKEKYSSLVPASGDVALIEYEYVLEAVVIGNDISSNIYKTIYVRDESGAMNISIDAYNLSTTYRVGQKLFIQLHNLYMTNYSGVVQIGYDDSDKSNRLQPDMFAEHAFKDGWPDEAKAQPVDITIAQISDKYLGNLVRFSNVTFEEGGTATFVNGNNAGERYITDGTNRVMVRTTTYANFKDEILPTGTGDVIAIVGKFNTTWQLALRDINDVVGFTGGGTVTPPGPDPGDGEVIFNETFGTETLPTNPRYKIADYTGYAMGSPVVYSDPTGRSDLRSTNTFNNHVWLPAGVSSLVISGINTSGYEDITLSFDLTANVGTYDDSVKETDLNALKVVVDGVSKTIPSTVVKGADSDQNKYFAFTITDIPSKANLSIEFQADAGNAAGMRIDNIKLTAGDGGGTVVPPDPTPGTEKFSETFGPTWRNGETTTLTKSWAEFVAMDQFDMKSPIAYSVTGNITVRNTRTYDNPHLWLPADTETEFKISGIPTGYTNATLSYDIACNLEAGGAPAAGVLLKCNGSDVTIPSTTLGAQNVFSTIKVDIPDNTTEIIFYSTTTSNPTNYGYRLDNIKITVAN